MVLEGDLNFELQINQWITEISTIRNSIVNFNLRELVEKRVLNYPNQWSN